VGTTRTVAAPTPRRVGQVWPHAEQTENDVMPLSGSVVPSWSPVKIGTGFTNLGRCADVRPTLSF
jgi:hypothetical protein